MKRYRLGRQPAPETDLSVIFGDSDFNFIEHEANLGLWDQNKPEAMIPEQSPAFLRQMQEAQGATMAPPTAIDAAMTAGTTLFGAGMAVRSYGKHKSGLRAIGAFFGWGLLAGTAMIPVKAMVSR